MKTVSLILLIVLGHGVEVYTKNAKAVVIEAKYSDGTPMANAFFTAESPSGKKVEGTFDETGKFIFLPEEDGKWKITVDDGLGHGKIFTITIRNREAEVSHAEKHYSQLQKIVTGASLIFGITGILFYIVTRRKYAHTRRIS